MTQRKEVVRWLALPGIGIVTQPGQHVKFGREIRPCPACTGPPPRARPYPKTNKREVKEEGQAKSHVQRGWCTNVRAMQSRKQRNARTKSPKQKQIERIGGSQPVAIKSIELYVLW